MELENTLYGGVQLAHNFGAAAVTGLPAAALWFRPAPTVLRGIAWLTLFAWLVQSASGAGFGLVSYAMEGQWPEIHPIARVALVLKIGCAGLAVVLLAMQIARRAPATGKAFWAGLTVLGMTALSCAAILRWFS